MSRRSILALGAGAIVALIPFAQGCDSIVGEDIATLSIDGSCFTVELMDAASAGESIPSWADAGEDAEPTLAFDAEIDADIDAGGDDDTRNEEEDVPVLLDVGARDDGKSTPADPARDAPAPRLPDAASDSPGDVIAPDLVRRDVQDTNGGTSPEVNRDTYSDPMPQNSSRDANDALTDAPSPRPFDGGIESLSVDAWEGSADASDVSLTDVSITDAPSDEGAISRFDVGVDIAEIDVAVHLPDAPPSPVDVGGPVVVKQVSAGTYHTCGLRNDGTVFCWGSNSAGQSTPPYATFFSQIDAGDSFTCGVKLDGTVACWGSDNYGQSTAPLGQFLKVATGSNHACGILTGGTVACWGYNTSSQSTPPGGTFTEISAGSLHTCGIRPDKTVACWGNNTYSQTASPSGAFSRISARHYHNCTIRTAGTVACWGSNTSGESTPPSGTFLQVAAGFSHSCGILDDRTVVCWGNNGAGQSTPSAGTFINISAGFQHTCGVQVDGTVACWGSNSAGQASPP